MTQTTYGQDIFRTDFGNGIQRLFLAPLPYETTSEIYVYLWELNATSGLYEWVAQTTPNDYNFVNAGTIEFNTAPPSPPSGVTANIKIVRSTSISTIRAVFQPGSAIRARDLNDNFNQLLSAAQEAANNIDQIQIEIDSGDFTLPKASATILGGIKVGSGLAINSDGVLAATGGGGGGGAVTSVNGKQGDVLLTASDVGALPDTTPLNFIPLNDWSSLPQVTA